jgi:hypothetical protein
MIVPSVDFYLDGDWLDKTTDVRENPPIKITGGVKDESTSASPSRCTFTMNNSSGNYNPRDPLGIYYEELGKNTPIRVRVPLLEDNISETDTDGWGTNWTNAFSSGGTVADTDWTRTGTTNVHHIPVDNAYRRSTLDGSYWDACVRYRLTLPTSNIAGGLVQSEIEFGYTDENNYIAAQFVFTTTETVQVQVSEVIAGVTRNLLGLTTVPDLNVFVDQSFEIVALREGQVIRLKIWPTGDPEPLDWLYECTRASIRYGSISIASVVAVSNSNTKPFNFTYDNFVVEGRPFTGEATSFSPGVSDHSHAAPYVQITASGITQRTIQGSEPLDSAMKRYWSSSRRWIRSEAAIANLNAPNNNTFRTTDADAANIEVGYFFRLTRASLGNISNFYTAVEDQMFTITGISSSGGNTTFTFTPYAINPVLSGDEIITYLFETPTLAPLVYWPCEDGKGTTQISSGLVGGEPMTVANEIPKYGESDTFTGSGPILKLNNAELNGLVPDYTDTDQAFTFHTLYHYPKDNDTGHGQAFVQLWTDSTSAEVWLMNFSNSGADLTVDIQAIDVNGAGQLFFHSYGFAATRDKPTMFVFYAVQTGGSTVEYKIDYIWYGTDGTANQGVFNQVVATGVTKLGKLKRVQVNPGGGYIDVAIGHIAAVGSQVAAFNVRDAPGGHTGEAPIRRFNRMAYEEDVPLTYCQGLDSTSFMGPQQQATLLTNWKHVAEFDLGRFYEARGAYSFVYRVRSSLYNQSYFMDIDYSNGGVRTLDTSDDDQATRNDITVKQFNGSSYRTVDETGPLSVLPPGEGGVGRYTDAPEISTLSSTQLPALAGWRLGLGTINEERYPSTIFLLEGDVTLAQMLSCEVGNRYRLTNLQARGIYEPIDQLVAGYVLTLHQYVPTLEINGTPSSIYNIAELDDGMRLDSDDSQLFAAIDDVDTTFVVWNVTVGSTWTTDAAEFPFDITIGGERMTVTNITGAGHVLQDFTVTRSVNGVVKPHSANTKVSLSNPVYLPL